jgi:hypothetical protein
MMKFGITGEAAKTRVWLMNDGCTMNGLRTIDGGRSDTVQFTCHVIAIVVDICPSRNSDPSGTIVKGRFR